MYRESDKTKGVILRRSKDLIIISSVLELLLFLNNISAVSFGILGSEDAKNSKEMYIGRQQKPRLTAYSRRRVQRLPDGSLLYSMPALETTFEMEERRAEVSGCRQSRAGFTTPNFSCLMIICLYCLSPS